MGNKIANRQVICEVLTEHAKEDKEIVVLCSDSRGSASLAPFFKEFPEQSVEVGIAEQDLVGIAAGLAKAGKKAFAASPASFITTRSYEQCKVDCAYSDTNVKLIGISGGVSYGALGMSHHSAQDISAMSSIPGMRVYLPSDRHQTRKLMESLLQDEKCAYIRTGRNAVEDVYSEEDCPFEMDRATVVREGKDAVIIACVLDMYCVKPLDQEAIIRAAQGAKVVVTVEEHSPFGGLGSMVAQVVSANCPKKVVGIALPDASVITGTSKEVFEYYGMNAEGIAETVRKSLRS